jgi:RNA polymerase sigma-70 factor (ECF subfamily)
MLVMEFNLAVHKAKTSELIQRAVTDDDAFTQVFYRHYDMIFRYCAHRLFDRHAAEDVSSTVFLKIVRNIGRFEGDDLSFKKWLFKIANNAINDYLRQQKQRASTIEAVVDMTRTNSSNPKVNSNSKVRKLALLRKSILNLKPKYQAVIMLHFFEEMKLIEIANILGSKPSTVRNWLHRALVKLRKSLSATEIDNWREV